MNQAADNLRPAWPSSCSRCMSWFNMSCAIIGPSWKKLWLVKLYYTEPVNWWL